jgi:hypothetical protein
MGKHLAARGHPHHRSGSLLGGPDVAVGTDDDAVRGRAETNDFVRGEGGGAGRRRDQRNEGEADCVTELDPGNATTRIGSSRCQEQFL